MSYIIYPSPSVAYRRYMAGVDFAFLVCPTEKGRKVVAINYYYFRISAVVVVAAMVAVLAAYGTALA
jgi:uncharacterized membrane protein